MSEQEKASIHFIKSVIPRFMLLFLLWMLSLHFYGIWQGPFEGSIATVQVESSIVYYTLAQVIAKGGIIDSINCIFCMITCILVYKSLIRFLSNFENSSS